MKNAPDRDRVITRASQASFSNKLILNVWRAQVVEAMLALVLEPKWRWCSKDYNAWDFQLDCPKRIRLEVKQSAARQTWMPSSEGPSSPRFDIAPRTGFYEGKDWKPAIGRNAEIYIFAHHPVLDDEADHADPLQWRFYVIAESQLPAQNSISLGRVQSLCTPLDISEVHAELDRLAEGILNTG